MKVLYGTVIVLASISGLHAMDNVTKQTAGMSLGSKFKEALSSSTPDLSIVSPRANLLNESPRTPRFIAPRAPSPIPDAVTAQKLVSYSVRRSSSSSLPAIPEKQ